MSAWDDVKESLHSNSSTWLVTGAAGFIGSNLAEFLISHGQNVVGFDNFSTGKEKNIAELLDIAAAESGSFHFIKGDVRDFEACKKALLGVDYVLHQAALGSVPRSIKDPLTSNSANVDGTLNIFEACRQAEVNRVVFASSSSIYGSSEELPKKEGREGRPLSPYAVTKVVNELYADNYSSLYDMSIIGLRYFNVFGKRQDPNGPYAAVIPRWVGTLLNAQTCEIYGDGKTSRDFCHIDNVVQANVLAAKAQISAGNFLPLNIACESRTTLTELFGMIASELVSIGALEEMPEVQYSDFRPGDVKHSLASTALAKDQIGYKPAVQIQEGIKRSISWYVQSLMSC